MKQYLYRVEPTGTEILAHDPPPEVVEILQQHVAYVRELTESGVVVLAGRTCTTDETTFGIIIFNAESDAAAREIMNNDPGVKSGLMQAKLFPYQIAFANITHAIRR